MSSFEPLNNDRLNFELKSIKQIKKNVSSTLLILMKHFDMDFLQKGKLTIVTFFSKCSPKYSQYLS